MNYYLHRQVEADRQQADDCRLASGDHSLHGTLTQSTPPRSLNHGIGEPRRASNRNVLLTCLWLRLTRHPRVSQVSRGKQLSQGLLTLLVRPRVCRWGNSASHLHPSIPIHLPEQTRNHITTLCVQSFLRTLQTLTIYSVLPRNFNPSKTRKTRSMDAPNVVDPTSTEAAATAAAANNNNDNNNNNNNTSDLDDSPVRVLVQTQTHLVPGDRSAGFGEREDAMVNLICQHVWQRDFDKFRERDWNYHCHFAVDNVECWFLIDHHGPDPSPPPDPVCLPQSPLVA